MNMQCRPHLFLFYFLKKKTYLKKQNFTEDNRLSFPIKHFFQPPIPTLSKIEHKAYLLYPSKSTADWITVKFPSVSFTFFGSLSLCSFRSFNFYLWTEFEHPDYFISPSLPPFLPKTRLLYFLAAELLRRHPVELYVDYSQQSQPKCPIFSSRQMWPKYNEQWRERIHYRNFCLHIALFMYKPSWS